MGKTPPSLTDHVSKYPGLGARLMIEAYEKICPNTYEGRSEPSIKMIANEAWREAGYCLDAPNFMPAGACFGVEVVICNHIEKFADQMVCYRDGE